jgi:hypothetical protein
MNTRQYRDTYRHNTTMLIPVISTLRKFHFVPLSCGSGAFAGKLGDLNRPVVFAQTFSCCTMVQPILGCPEEDTPHSPIRFEQDFLDWFLVCLPKPATSVLADASRHFLGTTASPPAEKSLLPNHSPSYSL